MHLVSQSPDDTRAIAAKLAKRLIESMPRQAAIVVALRGELGAGKTTFTQGFAKALGVVEAPKSPTFNLMKGYPIPGTSFHLWHLDCYRMNDHRDLVPLDVHTQFADHHNLL